VTLGRDTSALSVGDDNNYILPTSILETLQRPANQIIQKDENGDIMGMRYVVATEPSTLRPIKSWTITIEKWHYKTEIDIIAEDVLFLRLKNFRLENGLSDYSAFVKDIVVNGQKCDCDQMTGFHAVMAAGIFINKIDASRMPDADKILKTYRLI
jgi:hypothetical protein